MCEWIKKKWEWMGQNEKQIKIVFTFIAAAYVLCEYQAKIKYDHVANSIEYVRRYSDGKILASRESLDAFGISNLYIKESRKLQAEPNVKVRKRRYHEIIPRLLKTNGKYPDVYTILQFYRDIGLCVSVGRCDRETVCNYFFKDMQSFRENYAAILIKWEQSIGETAPKELSDLVQQKCADKFAEYCKKQPDSDYCIDSHSIANK